jgi:hypothetical protein
MDDQEAALDQVSRLVYAFQYAPKNSLVVQHC